jgi:hypothetical protein
MDSENDKKALTESELIDRQVEEIMTDEDTADGSGKRKKKRRKKARSGEKPSLKERWKGYSRKRKIITVVVVLAAAAFLILGNDDNHDTAVYNLWTCPDTNSAYSAWQNAETPLMIDMQPSSKAVTVRSLSFH